MDPHAGRVALQSTLAETGAGRLLIETFSPDQAQLFAREVMPDLRSRNASRLGAYRSSGAAGSAG